MADKPGFDLLRQEIIEAQKARTDLLKYKLVVCALLGAVAIGANGNHQVPYVVGIIPLVCLYIDALCDHHDLRILVIARYLRDASLYSRYEQLCQKLRGVYIMEIVALHGSSFLLGFGLFTFGVFADSDISTGLRQILCSSGGFGMLATGLLHWFHKRQCNVIDPKRPKVPRIAVEELSASDELSQ